MKSLPATAIIALMTAALGVGAVAPAIAQDAPPAPAAEAPADPATPPAPRPGHPGMRGMGFGFFGPGMGAEAVEIALVRLSYALDLTSEQETLLETLRTDAVAAAETFQSATEALMPEADEAAAPDFSDLFETRLVLAQAQFTALEAVEPAFTAFFDSLTDEQKASLVPERGERPGFGHRFGEHGMRPMVGPARN